MFRPVGPAGTAACSTWNEGPFSILASVLFGHVVGFARGSRQWQSEGGMSTAAREGMSDDRPRNCQQAAVGVPLHRADG
eukprot:7716140-Alexandrium_andersonii.AAC.1